MRGFDTGTREIMHELRVSCERSRHRTGIKIAYAGRNRARKRLARSGGRPQRASVMEKTGYGAYLRKLVEIPMTPIYASCHCGRRRGFSLLNTAIITRLLFGSLPYSLLWVRGSTLTGYRTTNPSPLRSARCGVALPNSADGTGPARPCAAWRDLRCRGRYPPGVAHLRALGRRRTLSGKMEPAVEYIGRALFHDDRAQHRSALQGKRPIPRSMRV